jgi:methionine--tRNA ligase beta chain
MEEQIKEIKEQVSYEDFSKMKIVVGEIIEAEQVGKKIIKLIIDIGDEKRQVLAGIYHYYKPEEIKGKRVLLIANMEPKNILGYESKGMLLVAFDGQNLSLLQPERNVKIGAKVL